MAKRDCQGRHASLIYRIATAGFIFCLGPVGLQADDRPDRRGNSPPPPPTVHHTPQPSQNEGPSSGHPVASQIQLATQRTALNPLLVRDRRHRLLLTRGTTALRHGRSQEGLAHLQALLDASQDAFYWADDCLLPHGARTDVICTVRSSPESVRRDYERLHGAIARDLQLRYHETRDYKFLVELIQRFSHTDAARDAAIRQLLISHDTGRLMLAREWARFLKADPFHWDRVPFPIKRLAITHLSNPVSHDVSLFQRQKNDNSSITHHVSQQRFEEVADSNIAPYPVPIWATSFDIDLHSSTTELTYDTTEPQSNTEPLLAKTIRESYDAWFTHRMEYSLPIASANEAIVADDVLIVRDFTHVRAVNIHTGHKLWKYPCMSSLATSAAQSIKQSGHGQHGGTLDFHTQFTGNSVLGRMATDNRRVFILDKNTIRSRCPNQLIALPVKSTSPQGSDSSNENDLATPLWIRGTLSNIKHDDLANHALLGCPLCVDDRLYLLAELEQQISLFALEAATGKTIWKQGIALVKRAVTEDALRLRSACTPLYHDGIICCPTEVGIVVGVEALTGRLLWVYDHMDKEQRQNSGRWAFSNGRNADQSLLPNHSYMHHGRLLYLPSRSRYVHCLDAETGEVVWTQPRNDAHAIGGVTESSVLLLGDRECLALSVIDGHLCWQTSTPEPAGTGIVAGDQYLLPTTNGPCLSINTQDGRIEGQRFRRLLHQLSGNDQTPAGNLLAHDNLIIATTPLAVRVYPQAKHRLSQLTAASHRGPVSDMDRLLQAQLLMTVGDSNKAGQVLQQILSGDPPDDVRLRSEKLWREVLYSQLESSEDPFHSLSQLASLARTVDERLRLQLSRLAVSIKHDDVETLIDTFDEFQALPTGSIIFLNGNEEYTVSAEHCFRDRLAALLEDEQPILSEAVAAYLNRKSQKLVQSMNIAAIERFVTLFADWPQTEHAQSLLAENWIQNSRHQQAELLLLSQVTDNSSRAYERVNHLLAELYVDRGFKRESERFHAKNSYQDASVPIWKHRLASLGREPKALSLHLTSLINHQPSAMLREDMTSPTTEPGNYSISEHRCIGSCPQGGQCGCQLARKLRDTDGLRHVFVPQLSGSILVLDHGRNKNKRTHSRLTLVDRDSGTSHGVIDVPSAYWQVPRPLTTDAGHMMIISGEAAHGISLLEAKTMWSVSPETSGRKSEKVKIGPTGSDFCVLQTSRELRVVHPGTGQTLWKRTHLPPGIGLLSNESIGIIGDSHMLCVFDTDQTSYTIYNTLSGRQIRQGTRQLAPGANRRKRWAVGRHLVEVISDVTGCRLCIWDSRTDRLTNDIPLTERLATPLPGEKDFACITSHGHLQILHAASGDVLLDLPLKEYNTTNDDGSRVPSALTVFADRERFYININTESDKTELGLTAPTDDFDVPHVRVRGRLIAIDRREGIELWDRIVPDACLPIQPESAPSLLTLVSRATDSRSHRSLGNNNTTTSLTVEVMDPSTGITLACRDQLLRSRVVGYRCSSMPHGGNEIEEQQMTSGVIYGEPINPPTLSHSVIASLIGLDSQIDVHVHTTAAKQPLRIASDEATILDR